MADQITRWSPDSCGCQIDVWWRDDEPVETRVHRAVAVTPCAVHAGIATGAPPVPMKMYRRQDDGRIAIISDDGRRAAPLMLSEHPDAARAHAAVHEENTRKNIALDAARKAGVGNPTYTFDADRNVEVVGAEALNGQQRAALAQAIQDALGQGRAPKVRVK